jgi:hypothetical protein
MKLRRALLAVVIASLAAATAACASGAGDGTRADSADSHATIAALHQRKCGSCHRLVEPSTRSRATIVDAMGRHEKRLRLSPAEWSALTDYLAPETTSMQAKTTPDPTATR